MNLRYRISVFAITFLSLVFMKPPLALPIVNLTDKTIDQAILYGLLNQEVGLSLFLGGNWREGSDGTLLNIYTPFMQLARSAAHQKMTVNPGPEDVAKARQKIIEDIDYIWHHPTIKFNVSLYGENPSFAKNYYAVIEGVAKGRNVTLYPSKSIPQYLADKEENVSVAPYMAVNSYHFKFEQVLPLDEFVFKLYGKNIKPITFKVLAKDIY